jgi:hypothetical protein
MVPPIVISCGRGLEILLISYDRWFPPIVISYGRGVWNPASLDSDDHRFPLLVSLVYAKTIFIIVARRNFKNLTVLKCN